MMRSALKTPISLVRESSPVKDVLHSRATRLPYEGLLELLPHDISHEGVVLEQHIREGRFQRSLSLINSFLGATHRPGSDLRALHRQL